MMAVSSIQQDREKSLRSVFVGNIAYDASEHEIKEILSQAGPVITFRIVLDRDTGKPKGYGFGEFIDQQTAESAIRNLNGFTLHGRALRVDSAAGGSNQGGATGSGVVGPSGGGPPGGGGRHHEELRDLQAAVSATQQESSYGPDVADPTKAPEAISKAVASLPPEQMFELMKQMKMCIQNNPNEARQMLLTNPQLAYALLQAQVVMRIVDPQLALSLLHRDAASTTDATQPSTSAHTASSSSSTIMPHQMPLMMPPHQTPLMMQGNLAPVQNQMQQGDADREKLDLIAEVLRLSEEQIALLPLDQQQSVRLLRDQYANQGIA